VLSLLDALPEDSSFVQLDPPQRRQRTLDALKRIVLRESQEQPLLLVFEDLHWIDSETQALLQSLVESLPTARLLLLVNYRPEYHHDWGSKTYYTQLRLAPPTPSPDTPGGAASITSGQGLFRDIGCALCHTPTLHTGNATVEALRQQPVNLFSDLLLHDMGAGLADGITQGEAGPREFRTAPLWGVGQRIFLLHDGRTTDLLAAIQAHQSGSSSTNDASEANAVIQLFTALPEPQKQDLLNFLRSL
jgi:hypothetical protein